MLKKWRLREIQGEIIIVRRSELDEEDVAAAEPRLAANLDRWFADTFSRQTLMDIYEHVNGGFGQSSRQLRDHELQRAVKLRLEEAFRFGELVILIHEAIHKGGVASEEKPQEQPKPKAPPKPQPKEKKTWIKFRVVLDKTSQPINGVQLKIFFPDGAEMVQTTRSNGLIEINNIDPGLYAVSSVIEKARLPQTYGFVKMGEQPSSQTSASRNQQSGTGQNNQAPPSDGNSANGNSAHGNSAGGSSANGSSASVSSASDNQPKNSDGNHSPIDPNSPINGSDLRIALIHRHKVRTNESLSSLAKANGISEKDLLTFNFGTTEPQEINRHLRDRVGCTKRTRDGRNYIFDSTDKPGFIYIPKPWKQSGLETARTHTIRVKRADGFYVILENEIELRIPEADYEATLADGSKHKGQLGRGGVDLIEDPPPGRVIVDYLDHQDVKAKSLAACARKSFDDKDTQEIFRVLDYSPQMIKKVIAAYEKYFNDYTGKGLIEDILQDFTDPRALMAAKGALARAGIPVREPVQYVKWEESNGAGAYA
jgi:LysM repeat protein